VASFGTNHKNKKKSKKEEKALNNYGAEET
jgi:hypothetical protein